MVASRATGGILGATHTLGRVLVASIDTAWGSRVRSRLIAAGFETEECDARDVLTAVTRYAPDLVVIVTYRPLSSVMLVCRWMRACSAIPLVVVSDPVPLDVVDVLNSGADLVLESSIGEAELIARIRGLLRRYPPRSSPRKAQVASGISIDRQRQEVLLSQGRVHLVGQEFDLLVLLFDRAPKVMTRRVLHEALHVDDVVLDRVVRRLRERLEAVEEWRRIQTVRGVGFRLLDCDPGRPIDREPPQTS